MDGEDLHGVGVRLGQARFETTFAVARRLQPGQERAERGPVGARGETVSHVGERVQVRPRCSGCATRPRRHLDVDEQRPLHLPDQLRERQGRA